MKHKLIYKGNVRKLRITNFEMNNGAIKKLEYEKPVFKEDILFYRGLFGTMISFDYGTKLPDEGEAFDVATQSLLDRKEPDSIPYPSCIFVNYNEIKKYKYVTKEEFKQMVKTSKKK